MQSDCLKEILFTYRKADLSSQRLFEADLLMALYQEGESTARGMSLLSRLVRVHKVATASLAHLRSAGNIEVPWPHVQFEEMTEQDSVARGSGSSRLLERSSLAEMAQLFAFVVVGF